MKLIYIKQADEPVGDAGDQYTGLDRFGRVVDQRWPQGSNELERVDYGFTAASNRQWRQNLVAAGGQDEYYNYDGLYQVAELNRGTLNGTKTAISGTPNWTEDFTYDPIGNWDNYLTKVSGVTDLDQERTHNTANETVEIDGSTATVGHDLAGNMVKVPQVADWSSTNGLKWDAWNRLVSVKAGSTTVAEYSYDGLTRRVTKETGATRHYYYSDQWQILEESIDDETTAERQFIWGQRYLDDLVLRDRDVDHDGSLDERLYALSDYFNPTAIADEDGVVVERYGYNAFGLSRVMDADFGPRSSSDFDWETRYGAYRWDGETGFYQVRYRYLHPTLGRWLSRDPIGEAGGVNAYAYVSNNTPNNVDLLGLWTGGDHKRLTELSLKDPDVTKALGKCAKEVLQWLQHWNLQQDEGDAFKENRRHFNRNIDKPTGSTAAQLIKDFTSYLGEESKRYNKALEEEKPGIAECKKALESLGRLTHSWQDYYAHAIILENGKADKILWTRKTPIKGSPDNPTGTDGKIVPSSWNSWNAPGEHGWGEVDGAEGKARQADAQSYVAKQYRTLVPLWVAKCADCCGKLGKP